MDRLCRILVSAMFVVHLTVGCWRCMRMHARAGIHPRHLIATLHFRSDAWSVDAIIRIPDPGSAQAVNAPWPRLPTS